MRKLVCMVVMVAHVVAIAGCSSTADRRLKVIHEAKLVLRHSVTEPAWAQRRAIAESEIQLEDPDEVK